VARIALLDLNGGKPNEAVALLRAAIALAGHDAQSIDVLAGEPLPEQPGAILATGGPGSPHAPGPWQVPLRTALRRALLQETPLFTICLGFQIAASELGSRVAPLQEPRFGIHPLHPTSAAAADPLVGPLVGAAAFEQRRWGVWAGDLQALATGPEGDVTCARLGPQAWGCVFHPEATAQALADWSERPDAARKLQTRLGPEALGRFRADAHRVQAVHETLLQGWLTCLA